jgi:hypothetical protein
MLSEHRCESCEGVWAEGWLPGNTSPGVPVCPYCGVPEGPREGAGVPA